jgi:carboxymethylenebutenolidase
VCHADDSRPPAPPRVGGVTEQGPIELTSSDGTAFAAYQAMPAQPNGANMVILPDIRGLHPYYMALAARFAEAGYGTIAIDYFGRTAGVAARDDSFDWQQHIPLVRPANVVLDAGAAAERLNAEGPKPTYTVGFCFGGGHSWRLAASELDLAGTIGFYGRPAMVQDVLEQLRRPLLMLIAGADAATPLEQFQELDGTLSGLGKEHTMVVYDGAPHSFFDRAFADWQEACADAWRQILGFTGVSADSGAGA